MAHLWVLLVETGFFVFFLSISHSPLSTCLQGDVIGFIKHIINFIYTIKIVVKLVKTGLLGQLNQIGPVLFSVVVVLQVWAMDWTGCSPGLPSWVLENQTKLDLKTLPDSGLVLTIEDELLPTAPTPLLPLWPNLYQILGVVPL
jgi:hypothetical protein